MRRSLLRQRSQARALLRISLMIPRLTHRMRFQMHRFIWIFPSFIRENFMKHYVTALKVIFLKGLARMWAATAGFRVHSANHYTTRPDGMHFVFCSFLSRAINATWARLPADAFPNALSFQVLPCERYRLLAFACVWGKASKSGAVGGDKGRTSKFGCLLCFLKPPSPKMRRVRIELTTLGL